MIDMVCLPSGVMACSHGGGDGWMNHSMMFEAPRDMTFVWEDQAEAGEGKCGVSSLWVLRTSRSTMGVVTSMVLCVSEELGGLRGFEGLVLEWAGTELNIGEESST